MTIHIGPDDSGPLLAVNEDVDWRDYTVPSDDRRLTTADIAARLGVKPVTIRAYVSRGQMPPPTGRLGRTPWWSAEEIEPWIAARKGK